MTTKKFNSLTRLDLKQELEFLGDDALIEKVILVVEEALIIPLEHREVVMDARKIPTA